MRHGKSSANKLMVVYANRNRKSDFRVGFCVSKKIGGAVVRNRIRRRLKEAIIAIPELQIKGWDLIVIARAQTDRVDFSLLGQGLLFLSHKAGLPSNAVSDEQKSSASASSTNSALDGKTHSSPASP